MAGAVSALTKRSGVHPVKCRNADLHGERDDEQPQANERHVKRRRHARPFDTGGDFVWRAADDTDPHQRHEDRERCDDASRPSDCAPDGAPAAECENQGNGQNDSWPGKVARQKRPGDHQQSKQNRAVGRHVACVRTGASKAMNSRGVAR